MNTIPSTSSAIRVAYTVIGERKLSQQPEPGITLLLLPRAARLFKLDLLSAMEGLGFLEIVSIEEADYDIETLSKNFPHQRFILLQGRCNPGELVNVGIKESSGSHVLVLWDDMKLASQILSSRLVERLMESDMLCTVPQLLDAKGNEIPSLGAPAFYQKRYLKVVSLGHGKESLPSLFPADYCGLYSRDRFVKTGGFDHRFESPYWQKVDFGFRAHLWGEKIAGNPGLRVQYANDIPLDDTTVNRDYRLFYLKNLLVRFNGDSGSIPLSRALSYVAGAGTSYVEAYREFKEARAWVKLNRFRFRQDARAVTELWEVPEE